MKKPAKPKRGPVAVRPRDTKKRPEVKNVLFHPPASKAANRYFILAFLLWALILYGNTVLNKYAVDDEFVTNNALVKQGLKALPEIFTSHYFSQKGNVSTQTSDYRPIVKATFAIEYALYGEQPGVSHGVNILIYFCLSTALFFVLKRFLKNYNILFPFLITLVFMAHPVHTEVVASLKNRDEMLAFLAAILAMHYLLKFADSRKISYVFIAVLLFMAGYLAKPSIIPFLALYPLVFYFFTDLKPRSYLPIILALMIMGLLAHFLPRLLVLPPAERFNSFVENPLFVDKSIWHRLGTGFIGLLFYLKILVYPHPLLYYYGYNQISYDHLGNIWALLSIVLYAVLFIYAMARLREKHLLSFAILWYLIAISMYSNVLVPVVGIVGERFVFVGSLGFCIILVYFIFRIFKTDPKSLTIEFDSRAKIIVILALVLIPYTALTMARNREWRNMYELFRKDIPYLNNSAKANTQYAGYLMKNVYTDPDFMTRGSVNESLKETIIGHFQQSLKIYPDQYQTLNDLGTVYLFFDKNADSAIFYLTKAITLKPDLIPAWVNLGMSYREKGQYEKAIECYNTIMKNRPGEIRAFFALANIYNDMGDFNRAVQMNEEVIRNYPELDMPYINIGNYYIQRGDTATAVKNFETALAKRPSYEGAMQLTYLYKIQGNQQKADYYTEMARQLFNQQPRR
jgi:tetratricopeptide (TPR) repeat protein